jgi:hypothetical protein
VHFTLSDVQVRNPPDNLNLSGNFQFYAKSGTHHELITLLNNTSTDSINTYTGNKPGGGGLTIWKEIHTDVRDLYSQLTVRDLYSQPTVRDLYSQLCTAGSQLCVTSTASQPTAGFHGSKQGCQLR